VILKPAFVASAKFLPNLQRMVENIELNKGYWNDRFGEYEERRK